MFLVKVLDVHLLLHHWYLLIVPVVFHFRLVDTSVFLDVFLYLHFLFPVVDAAAVASSRRGLVEILQFCVYFLCTGEMLVML